MCGVPGLGALVDGVRSAVTVQPCRTRGLKKFCDVLQKDMITCIKLKIEMSHVEHDRLRDQLTRRKLTLLRWQNSKGKHARVCLITERSVKKTDLCIIVKVGSDVKYENI